MSLPTHDLLGRPLTDVESKVAAIHAAITELCRQQDLAPCVAANARHALACTWQIMNDLDLPAEAPEDAAP